MSEIDPSVLWMYERREHECLVAYLEAKAERAERESRLNWQRWQMESGRRQIAEQERDEAREVARELASNGVHSIPPALGAIALISEHEWLRPKVSAADAERCP